MDETLPDFERLRRLMSGSCVRPLVHEVNNLLGAAMAYTELVQMEATLNEKSKRQLGETVAALQRCSQLINSYAQVVRPIRESFYSPDEIVRSALDMRAYTLRAQSVTVEYQCKDDTLMASGIAALTQFALVCALMEAERRLSPLNDERRLRISVTGMEAGIGLRIVDNALEPPLGEVDESRWPTLGLDLPELNTAAAQRALEVQGASITFSPETGFLMVLPQAGAPEKKEPHPVGA